MGTMKTVYKVKAKIERPGVEPFWLRVGTATTQPDGRIYMTLDALPLHSNGVLILYPKEESDS